jgi:hypothetical protein
MDANLKYNGFTMRGVRKGETCFKSCVPWIGGAFEETKNSHEETGSDVDAVDIQPKPAAAFHC